MKQKLSYIDEEDKCYGATGMAMAVVIFDGEDMLAGINLDAEPDEIMEFTDDFYFNGNPGFSAKTAWNQMIKNFNLAMALSIGNVVCRHIIHRSSRVDNETAAFLRSAMVDAGRDHCALEDDETQRLFDKNYAYLTRVFNHYGVQEVARDFANALKQSRHMTRFDVIEHLRALSML